MKNIYKTFIAVLLAVLAVCACGCTGRFDGPAGYYPNENTSANETRRETGDCDDPDYEYTFSDDDDYTYTTVEETLNFAVAEKDEDLEVEYYWESLDHRMYVYDTDYLYLIFDSAPVTKSDLISAVNGNYEISDKYKTFIKEYIDLLYNRYPDNNYRVFYENLKTMKVVECKDEFEMFEHCLSFDSYACYVAMENTVYTMDSYEYKKGTWEYQVIMHELSHALRGYRNEETGKMAQFADTVAGYGVIVEEALNSIFTVSLFDYEERDIAYQFWSNVMLAIISSMDNYDLNDYVNHSSSYFVKKLDEFTGHRNYASVMLKIMEEKNKDTRDDYYFYKEEEFYPFYRFICDIYFKNRLKAGMTDAEMKDVFDELMERMMYDVPDSIPVDTDYFYTYYNEYLAAHGLS